MDAPENRPHAIGHPGQAIAVAPGSAVAPGVGGAEVAPPPTDSSGFDRWSSFKMTGYYSSPLGPAAKVAEGLRVGKDAITAPRSGSRERRPA